jgi:(p)ppGpp synthase/HD superfamily hydrolase
VRKGSGVPYITHVMAVSALVGEYGGDEDQMIAALLHDTLEDCSDLITLPQIVESFGWRVGKIVAACSDCQSLPKPPWEPRKKAYLARLHHEDGDVKLVSAADKVHNATALLRDSQLHGDVHWSRFKAPKEQQCWYLRSCLEALCHAWWNPILLRLDEVVCALEQHCIAKRS